MNFNNNANANNLENQLQGRPVVKAIVNDGTALKFLCTFPNSNVDYLIPHEIMKTKYTLELIEFYEQNIVQQTL